SPSSIHALRVATCLSVSRGPSGGIRSSGSVLVTRLIISLATDLPGTAAFFATVARVSSDMDPLYVPLVWHLAQWALRIGTASWAKSTPFGGSAAAAGRVASAARISPAVIGKAKRPMRRSGREAGLGFRLPGQRPAFQW